MFVSEIFRRHSENIFILENTILKSVVEHKIKAREEMTKLRGPFAQWLSNRLSVSQCNANVQYYHWIADSRHRSAIPVFNFHAGYYNAVHNEEDIVLD